MGVLSSVFRKRALSQYAVRFGVSSRSLQMARMLRNGYGAGRIAGGTATPVERTGDVGEPADADA
jgi:hypothetical protein